ncbi:unnamed protein product [Choristocarpus tenellus]
MFSFPLCFICFHNLPQLAGPSMLPTFNRGSDIALTDRLTPRLWGVNRGDVVVTRTPQNVNQIVCKRIIATAGEIVLVKSKQWYMGTRKVKVPVGHVWIEGDNPNNSTDSRMYGPVPLALLQGRVVVKVWPLTEAGWLSRKVPSCLSHVIGKDNQELDRDE